MRKNLKIVPAIFPMPVLMIATYNEDGSIDVMKDTKRHKILEEQDVLQYL